MPLVRLTCTAAGRYDASRGDVIEITDEEFARWAPEGLVEAVDGSEAPAEAPAVEEPVVEVVVEDEAAEPAVEEKPKPARRARAPKAS